MLSQSSKLRLSLNNRLRLVGLFAAVAAILWDQVTKLHILNLFRDDPTRHIELAHTGPIGLDLVLWWNRGISFGLLHLPSGWMPLILSAVAVLTCIVLAVWLWRSTDRWQSLALGLVIGGAIGNVIDRLAYGAVVDFLYAYWNQHYWPAFNIADSCICVGVILLVLRNGFSGGLLGKRPKAA